jgi:hypothetical protein
MNCGAARVPGSAASAKRHLVQPIPRTEDWQCVNCHEIFDRDHWPDDGEVCYGRLAVPGARCEACDGTGVAVGERIGPTGEPEQYEGACPFGCDVPMWICEDCAWPWPIPGDPPDDAECDNCGGKFIREEL